VRFANRGVVSYGQRSVSGNFPVKLVFTLVDLVLLYDRRARDILVNGLP
jgi:hypothetical protein